MNLHGAILRAASLIVPAAERGEWLREWRSELCYVDPRQATRFSTGAFRDAYWMRRNSTGTPVYLESPLACIALLGALAGLGLLFSATLLPPLATHTRYWRLQLRDVPAGCAVMLIYTAIFLPITRLVMGAAPAHVQPAGWRFRTRNGAFLLLKIVLVQPIMLCGCFATILLSPLVPIPAIWLLTMRWVIADQRRRCPVCLHALTLPVRVGTASQTFLEWYGAESVCARGHGLLQTPETASSHAGPRRWLPLDSSWSALFHTVEAPR